MSEKEYLKRKAEAVEALINFFINSRGCSRLIAAGYAAQECKKRYDEISDNVNKP